jgi:uroporphyrin-3 C-methyltransferase
MADNTNKPTTAENSPAAPARPDEQEGAELTAEVDVTLQPGAAEPQSEAADTPGGEPAEAEAPARRNVLAGLAFILSLIALGVSAWLYYLSYIAAPAPEPDSGIDVRAELNAHAQKLSQAAASERQSLRDSATELQRGLQQELQSLRQMHEDSYQELKAAQTSQRQRLLAYATTDRSDWMLAEAEYMLRLASQRVIMTGDTRSAIALMSAADDILLELDDSELYPVRAAIATDLATLRAQPQIDVEGTWLRLQALIGRVDTLMLFTLPTAAVSKPPPAEGWKQRLAQGFRAALDKVSGYVVITSRDAPYKPVLSPQWEGMVRQNLRMLLEQARAALLSGNQTLYQHSLENTRHWLNEFFSLEESGVSALDSELEDLSTITVSQQYPDINGSLSALKTLINTRHMVAEGL